MTDDPGSVYDRSPRQHFVSRPFDTGSQSPNYLTLKWSARVPKKTSLKFMLRSASTIAGLSKVGWSGPTSPNDFYKAATSNNANPALPASGQATINKVHNGHRYIQYRAFFQQGYDFTNTPVLEKVEFIYK